MGIREGDQNFLFDSIFFASDLFTRSFVKISVDNSASGC